MAAASQGRSGSGSSGAATLKIINVAHGGISRRIALVPDLPADEINQIIRAQFALEQNVVALVSARRDAVYPLSLLSKNPLGLTTDATYPLLLSGVSANADTNDTSDEPDSESTPIAYGSAAAVAAIQQQQRQMQSVEDEDAADGGADGAGDENGDENDDDQDEADEVADENELFEYHAVVDKRISDASDETYDDASSIPAAYELAAAATATGVGAARVDMKSAPAAGVVAVAAAAAGAATAGTTASPTDSNKQNVAMIEFIQKHTAFARLPMTEIFKVFSRAANESEDGSLDRKTFERCFSELLSKDETSNDPETADRDEQIMSLIARRIFDVFDRDGNGSVDYSEFLSGISLLCRASSDDKIRAAFQLFDLDNDGYITLNEMTRYLSSFFEVCFALDTEMRKRFNHTTPAELGAATAQHCFKRADSNRDGSISYDEFRAWYAADDNASGGGGAGIGGI